MAQIKIGYLPLLTLAVPPLRSYDVFFTSFGVVVMVLLVILLMLKEMLRAWDGSGAGTWGKVVSGAIIPLLLLFGLIIMMRLVALL